MRDGDFGKTTQAPGRGELARTRRLEILFLKFGNRSDGSTCKQTPKQEQYDCQLEKDFSVAEKTFFFFPQSFARDHETKLRDSFSSTPSTLCTEPWTNLQGNGKVINGWTANVVWRKVTRIALPWKDVEA